MARIRLETKAKEAEIEKEAMRNKAREQRVPLGWHGDGFGSAVGGGGVIAALNLLSPVLCSPTCQILSEAEGRALEARKNEDVNTRMLREKLAAEGKVRAGGVQRLVNDRGK